VPSPYNPPAEEVEGFEGFSMKRLRSLFKYSRSKLKNQNPMAVDVLFKAYPMVQSHADLIWQDGTFND
jgi:hypothetical protein